MEIVRRNYDSFSALIEDALKPPHKDYPRRTERTSRRVKERYDEFHSCRDFDEAARFAFKWEDGAKRIGDIRGKIGLGKQRKTELRRRPNMPGALMMGDYLAGHPEPYAYAAQVPVNSERKGKSKVVRVLINLACSGGIPVEVMEARGAACLAMVDAIESAGYSAEVTVGSASQYSKGWGEPDKQYEYKCIVKRAGDRLNLNSVAFAIANIDTFRRIIFGAREHRDGIYSAMPVTFDNTDGYDIYVGEAFLNQPQWKSPEASRKWVIETLAAQGIELTEE